jgi:hypothetical protein
MKGALTQSDYSVRVFYPPGDAWKIVHKIAYENNCVANGCPMVGQEVRDNQGFKFPNKHSAETFLGKIRGLPEITAEIAKGDLSSVKI